MIPGGLLHLWPSLLIYLTVELCFLSTNASPIIGLGSETSHHGCKIWWKDPRHQIKWGVTRDDNQINNEENLFIDLCPVIGWGAPTQVVDRIVEAGPDGVHDEDSQGRESRSTRYIFEFGDSSRKGLKSVECSQRTWTCLTNRDRNPSLNYPSTTTEFGVDGEATRIVWTSPLDDTARNLARVYIKCDPRLTETSPSFIEEQRQGGVSIHTFTWETRHACARSVANQPIFHVTEDESPDGADSEAGPEGDLVSPNQPSFPQIFKIIFFICLTIAALCVLILYRPSVIPVPLRPLLPLKRFHLNLKARRSPPIPQSSGPSSSASDRSFRVGEDRLVRWAQEDMSLEGAGEVDVMVNGGLEDDSALGRDGEAAAYSYGYGYGAAGVGRMGSEYIPLKPSPFIGTSYGKNLWGARAGYGSVVIGR